MCGVMVVDAVAGVIALEATDGALTTGAGAMTEVAESVACCTLERRAALLLHKRG